MKKLKELVLSQGAKSRPADPVSIQKLEEFLGFALADEYRNYLSDFGVIVQGSEETYGLGVPPSSHLHVGSMYADLSKDMSYPRTAVPILELGDGQYYIFDNQTKKILLWATPNGGVVRAFYQRLEDFLIDRLFAK